MSDRFLITKPREVFQVVNTATLLNRMLTIYRQERGFVWTGLFGIVLGLIGVCFFLLNGNEIPPEGKWTKVITFDVGIGIFSLTTAVVAPWINMTMRQRRWFTVTFIISAWIAYFIETVQNVRGFDPRFTRAGTIWDIALGMVLGVVCVVIAGCVLFALVRVWKEKDKDQSGLQLSLVYGFICNCLGILSGVWMILLQGRVTGDGVDIMALHFLGFHGYQAIPIVFWLLKQAQATNIRRTVHLTGCAWIGVYFALLLQFVFGYAIIQMTWYTLAGLAGLALYCLIVLYSFWRLWRKARI